MDILRVEHRDGEGAYRVPLFFKMLDELDEAIIPSYVRGQGRTTALHPSPGGSGLYGIEEWEIFGFESHTDLIKWFFVLKHLDAVNLDRFGFEIVTYYVEPDHVRLGDRQCVFKQEEAVEISRTNPVDYYWEVIS